MHRVVVAGAAKGGEASEEGEGAGVRFDGETKVQAGDFWDDGEASGERLVLVEMRLGRGVRVEIVETDLLFCQATDFEASVK